MPKILTLGLALILMSAVPAQAVIAKAGAKCTKAGATSTVVGKKFTCIKTNGKLVWNKGVIIKKSLATKAGVCPFKSVADQNPGIIQARANTLITMTESAAEECAMNLDWEFRVEQRDEEMFALTRDYRIDRVTVTVMKGFVTQVNVG